MSKNHMINQELDGESFFLEGGEEGVLLIHGFTATTTEVLPLAKVLNEAGYSVSAPLLPGHSTTPDDMNRKKWQNWFACVQEALDDLRQRCRSVWVGGESMGGLLSLLLGARNPDLAGVLLYAPALRTLRRQPKSLIFLQYLVKYVAKGPGDGSPGWKGYDVYPLRAMVQLNRLQRQVRRELPDVQQAVLICMADKDDSVDPRVADDLMRALSQEKTELIWFKDSPHCMILGPEQEAIFTESLRFMRERV